MGKRFLWEVDGGERQELDFEYLYKIQESIHDLKTGVVFKPDWIESLEGIRTSTFYFSYDLIVIISPSVGGRITGPEEDYQFQSGFVVERPYWKADRFKKRKWKKPPRKGVTRPEFSTIRNALVQETANHFEASLHYIREWVNRIYGGTPPFFNVYLVRFKSDQERMVLVKKPKVEKGAKPPVKPTKPPTKGKGKPPPRREIITRPGKKGAVHQVVYRSAKTGRFVRQPKPGKRSK